MSCGFNIEFKYALPDEAIQESINTAEINIFIDRILDIVAQYAKYRSLVFSSFVPEVCLLLMHKQNQYPVFFLTDAGMSGYTGDPRIGSLNGAVRYAQSIGCAGIVSNAAALVASPNCVAFIKNQGLLVWSYGGTNDLSAHVQVQLDHGINGIITDRVKSAANVFNNSIKKS